MQPDEVLEALNAPLVDKRPLANGFNPWELARFDREADYRDRYRKALETSGVERVCEHCGETFRAHPLTRNQFTCRPACRKAMYVLRKKGADVRQTQPLPWRPEHRRKAHQKEGTDGTDN